MHAAVSATPSWGPRMWKLIDEQMTLSECAIYRYSPEEDPYEGDEGEEDGAIWSLRYFFFNKQRKRVCYIHLKGISVLSGSYHEHAGRMAVAQGLPVGGDTESSTSSGALSRVRATKPPYGYVDEGLMSSEEEESRERRTRRSQTIAVRRQNNGRLGEYAAIKARRNITSDDDEDEAGDEDDSDFVDDDDDVMEVVKDGRDDADEDDDEVQITGSRPVARSAPAGSHHPLMGLGMSTSLPRVIDGDVEMMLDIDEAGDGQSQATPTRRGFRDDRRTTAPSRRGRLISSAATRHQTRPYLSSRRSRSGRQESRRSQSPREDKEDKSSEGVSEQMAGMMEV
ncbi:RNA polymerase III-inhibiting protein maf1 [Ascosphaera acerosa]|nr:RNA polymerase III-inhibiting protein maf1 [Ascosphaera acerosa]